MQKSVLVTLRQKNIREGGIMMSDFTEQMEVKELIVDLRAKLNATQGQLERRNIEIGALLKQTNDVIAERDKALAYIANLQKLSSMDGVERIKQERQRQINQEGWTAEYDSKHISDELAYAAICYALPSDYRAEALQTFWHWWQFTEIKWWKPTPDDRIRELTKAGALIAAEIDRLILEGEKS